MAPAIYENAVKLLHENLMRVLRHARALRQLRDSFSPKPPIVRGNMRYLTRKIALKLDWKHPMLMIAATDSLSKRKRKEGQIHWVCSRVDLPSDMHRLASRLAGEVKSPRDLARILARIDAIVLWYDTRQEGLRKAAQHLNEAQKPWQDAIDLRIAISELAKDAQ